MNRDDSVLTAIESRCHIYTLLKRVFAYEPDAGMIKTLKNAHIIDVFSLFLNDSAALNRFYEALDAESNIAKLSDEYTRLFIGPDRLPAPPWESVYLAGDGTLFNVYTLAVRNEYLKYGFLPDKYPHDADDHIALELDFMSILSAKVQDEYAKNDMTQAKTELNACKNFLDKHLLVWIPEFAARLKGEGVLYPKAAVLLHDFLKADSVLTAELTDII